MLEILVLLQVLCVFRVTNVAAGLHMCMRSCCMLTKHLTPPCLEGRVSQLLTSYSERKVGERFNYYQRLLRGMPARLAKCRANRFGPCGK